MDIQKPMGMTQGELRDIFLDVLEKKIVKIIEEKHGYNSTTKTYGG